ncbi:hypothetical protein T07_3325 [Trichinella nelsoni]|uniref:Uncharacterized protein n=1 Tax=Trichinella nelsoni TaxID=6336 RepID=A0A0V0RV78_9BILA|nr:hypothetical protein T07_3325 [Trichinella nelsoni]
MRDRTACRPYVGGTLRNDAINHQHCVQQLSQNMDCLTQESKFEPGNRIKLQTKLGWNWEGPYWVLKRPDGCSFDEAREK